MTTLLDRTDTWNRLVQHGAILAGIGVLLIAARIADGSLPSALALIAVAAALFFAAGTAVQRFEVSYRGHSILLQNNPLRGEKLFVDGVRVAKGRIGVTSEMRAPLPSDEEIVVRTTAGLLTYRCRMEVVPGTPIQATDAQLLAEMRRRGLG